MIPMIRAETVLDSWKTVRQDTAQAVEDFPSAELDFKPVGDVMTFGEIAHHILVAGYGITGMLLDGVENLATPQFRERMQAYAAELPAAVGRGRAGRRAAPELWINALRNWRHSRRTSLRT